jgi:hypothetical protein
MEIYKFTEGFYAVQDGQLVEVHVKQMEKQAAQGTIALSQHPRVSKTWTSKECKKCKARKPIEQFLPKKDGSYQRVCQDCRDARAAQKAAQQATQQQQATQEVPGVTKTCAHCGKILPVSEFSKHTDRPGGLQSWCRQCKKEYNKIWQQNKAQAATKAPAVEQAPTTKVFSICNTKKPLQDFPKDTLEADGRHPSCWDCIQKAAQH